MTNDETGDVAAIMVVVGVCIDSIARKARPLPPDIFERINFLL
jgi:acyl-CoA thioesterase FadM